MAENNEKSINEVDINRMSLEEILAVGGIEEVQTITTALSRDPSRSRNGGEYEKGWVIYQVPTKGGPRFVGAFNDMLGSDFEDQGWSEHRIFGSLDAAKKALTPVVVDGLAEKGDDGHEKADLVDGNALVEKHKDEVKGLSPLAQLAKAIEIEDNDAHEKPVVVDSSPGHEETPEEHRSFVNEIAGILDARGFKVKTHVPVQVQTTFHDDAQTVTREPVSGPDTPQQRAADKALEPFRRSIRVQRAGREVARALAQEMEKDGFEFDPCDGCGSGQECEEGTFPCKVKSLQEYHSQRSSLACVVGISGITFVVMFTLAAWQFQVPGFYALDALLVGFMGMTCAMGMLAGVILHQVFLDRNQRRLRDLPVQWIYTRKLIETGVNHNIGTLLDGLLVALGNNAAELHVDQVDKALQRLVVVARPGVPLVHVSPWIAERRVVHDEDCEPEFHPRFLDVVPRVPKGGFTWGKYPKITDNGVLIPDFHYKARKHEVKSSGPNTVDVPLSEPGIDYKARVIASGVVFNHDTMAVDPARNSKRLQVGVSYVIYPKVALASFSQEQLGKVCEQIELDLGNGMPVSIVPPASLVPKDLGPEGYGGFEIVLEKVTIHDVDLVDIRERLEKALNALVVA